jgi:hypothetical protein
MVVEVIRNPTDQADVWDLEYRFDGDPILPKKRNTVNATEFPIEKMSSDDHKQKAQAFFNHLE